MDEHRSKIILPKIEEVGMAGRSVLVRADLDLPNDDRKSSRLRATIEIVQYLREQKAERIKVIGHKGHISLVNLLGVDINWDLRADPREEQNSPELAEELALGFDVYVNEAFAVSHRKHASIDALPRLMKSKNLPVCAGIRFAKEVEVLAKVEDGLVLIGGAKASDKAGYADALEKKGFAILRGGLLPGVALRADGLDISEDLVIKYKAQIASAKTIIIAGPMGKYEQEDCTATKEIFTAVAQSSAYKIAGGGDTQGALEKYGLDHKFDWISVGGGAMLEFLSTGTLVGIEAL